MKTPPNLFNYATSELSQDAFLLWLLDWANPDYKDADEQLNAAAQEFVRFLLDKNKNDLQIESVKCYKQLKNIDVLAIVKIVNNVFAILIEDKTDTSEHDNQLTNYTQWFENEGKKILNIENKPELHCIYYKTGNESYYYLNKLEKKYKNNHSNVAFKILLRSDILNVLKEVFPSSLNPIFIDYVNHLQKIENLTNSYQTEPAGEWKEEAWQGFYMELEKQLEMGNWGADYYHKGFRLPLCPITIDEKQIQLYLYIDKSRNLCIKAKCKAKCPPKKDYWDEIIKMIKGGLHEYLKSIDLRIYDISISDGNDIKLCDIKRLKNNKRSMFIRKTLSFSAQQPDIVNQLKELQKQLSTVAEEIKKTSYIEIK